MQNGGGEGMSMNIIQLCIQILEVFLNKILDYSSVYIPVQVYTEKKIMLCSF